MRTTLILIFIIVSSCSQKEEPKVQHSKFKKIPYSAGYNYPDSLAKKINPNKEYQYWQYAAFSSTIIDTAKYTIVKEVGDKSFRNKIPTKNNPIKDALFEGGHPNYRCNYAIYIENNKVNYVRTEDEFRTFLGSIDNLEEAILLAKTYGYLLDNDTRGSQYREIEDGFELHLMRWNEFPMYLESIEISIKKDGFIKTKSLGIYCEDPECL